MFIATLRRWRIARFITLSFAVTLTLGLIFVVTNTLVGHEADEELVSQKNAALKILCKIPDDQRKHISWGYVGAYRTSPGKTNSRIAFWQDDYDRFLSKAPDAAIVDFATIFTDENVVAVVRQLVAGKKSVADLSDAIGISEDDVEEAIKLLIDSQLAARTEDNRIEPKNDVGSFFLNFVSMTTVHLEHIKSEDK